MTASISEAWDGLHADPRFRPVYPSEPVVRFVARRLGALEAPPTTPADVLDIGCGAGRHCLLAARAGHHVTATDISSEGLDHASERLAAEGLSADLRVADMRNLPFEDESFDAVISYGVFNYGSEADFRGAVGEALRVLRHGGWLLVVTRTTDDDRFHRGRRIEPRTVEVIEPDTNERSMRLHFLDRDAIDDVFADFSDVIVDRIDHTAGGGALTNSDWVIEACR